MKSRGIFFEERDKRMRRLQRFFWIFFSFVLFLILASWAAYAYIALYILDNPDSVGNWIGKLISGISGS
jgi:hypothetical protein